MQFLPETEDRPPEINVVALIDVIFAILTFFIISSLVLGRTEGLAVNLPTARSGTAQDQTKIVVTISANGSIALNRQPIDLQQLTPKIKAFVERERAVLAIINADEKVGHGKVVAAMDALQQIPGVKIGIATKQQ